MKIMQLFNWFTLIISILNDLYFRLILILCTNAKTFKEKKEFP